MIERTYNIPLRKGFINKARYKKTKKAVTTLKEFLQQHMKSDNILIGKHLNEHLWKHGIKNPPHHVKVTVIKEDDGTVKAELLGFKYEHLKKDEKEKQEKKTAEKKEEKKKSEPAKKKEEKKVEALEEKADAETIDAVEEPVKESKPKKLEKNVKKK